MSSEMKAECDGILRRVTTVKDRVPGVVAMVTDRSANVYEGAMGERMLGSLCGPSGARGGVEAS